MIIRKMLVPGILSLLVFMNCSLLDQLIEDETPTKDKMEGVWQVTEAYDQNGNDILSQICFPITAFHFSSDNTVISTAGPMIMHTVYGTSKYTDIASKIDQTFNYAGLDLTGGEWFIDGGPVDRFTLEMKLEGLPGQKALTDLLSLLGIGNAYLDITIYHKFRDVKVTFEPWNDTTMTWEFDDSTSAVYNKKDKYGDYVAWTGWPTSSFSHSRFVLTKRSKDINNLITSAPQ